MLVTPNNAQYVRAALIGIAASVAFILVGLATEGWNPDPHYPFPYCSGLGGLSGRPAMLAGSAVLLLLVRLPLLTYLASLVVVILPYLVALAYELVRGSSGHNLFPIEIAIMLFGSGLLHLPAIAVRCALVAKAGIPER